MALIHSGVVGSPTAPRGSTSTKGVNDVGDPIDLPTTAKGERAPETADYLDGQGVLRVVAAGDVIPEGWKLPGGAKKKAPASNKARRPSGDK